MGVIAEVKELLKNDIRVDFRKNAALLASFIYIISAVFLVFLSFKGTISINTWNSLFWIIAIFSSLNMVTQGFIRIEKERFFFYYTICSPQAFILSKLIYNAFLVLLSNAFGCLIYMLFLGNKVVDLPQFVIMLFFGSMGIAVLFSLVTAIAYKANRNMTLAAILSLPLVLPLLVLLIAGTKVSIDDLGWTIYQDYLLSIVALDVILVILAYLLFPYLWRE